VIQDYVSDGHAGDGRKAMATMVSLKYQANSQLLELFMNVVEKEIIK